MKIMIEWGQKGRHSVRKQNEVLLAAMESMAKELENTRAELVTTQGQLREALAERVAKGHRLRVVQGGQARFQLGG